MWTEPKSPHQEPAADVVEGCVDMVWWEMLDQQLPQLFFSVPVMAVIMLFSKKCINPLKCKIT